MQCGLTWPEVGCTCLTSRHGCKPLLLLVHLQDEETTCVYTCTCRYFETFDVVSEVMVDARVKMMEMMTKCASREERGE